MKKAILIILCSGLFVSLGTAQNLLDIYKKGSVKLVADKTYGAKNNWESLFNLYYDTASSKNDLWNLNAALKEEYKKIVVAPDGSVFMSHKNRHEIWKFGSDGIFERKFGSQGGKDDQFPAMPVIQPIVDGKYVFTSDNNGKLKFFDLDGNFFKSIALKYMPESFQSLANGEILLKGKVIWKDQPSGSKIISSKWRHIVVSLNLYTGNEKVLYEYFEDIGQRRLLTSKPDSVWIVPPTPKDSKTYLPSGVIFRKPNFTLLPDGQFIISNSQDGNIKMYTNLGKEKSNFKLDINPVAITDKDVLENYETAKKMILRTIEMAKTMPDPPEDKVVGNTVTSHKSYPDKNEIIKTTELTLKKIEGLKNRDTYYPYLPYFSNIILDDEGNLLVFEFTSKEEKESNIFNVIAYDKNGLKLVRTSFICDDYDLSFSESTFVISKGYVYAVAKLKSTTGMPLRLVKFKISN